MYFQINYKLNNMATIMTKLVSTNPANNLVIDQVYISSSSEITEKVSLAHTAKKAWKELGVHKRVELLNVLLNAFKKHAQEIGELITLEIGKTTNEVQEDFSWDFDYFERFLNDGPSYIEDEITVNEGQTIHRIVYEPKGVVACIVPWNFPFANFVWSVIPNLIVGNTVIFKHSEECPLVGQKIDEIIQNVGNLPEGVFSQIYGGSDVGWELANQDLDLIWFTGSTIVGKKLNTLAGSKQIKTVLEMGGSNPAIVFPDADLNLVIPKIYKGRFTNCGQVCDAIKRVIVHYDIYEKLVDQLTKYIANITLGDPTLETTQLGPLAAMRQLELLESQVNDSVKKGAKVITGGSRPLNLAGAYYLPTILTNVDRNMRVWREEIFGPVLPIMPFYNEQEAIMLANDTIYGLGAAIYTQDLQLARRVAADIDAGFIDINEGNHWRQCNPFGGFKASGMGCEHGRHGFQELCRFKIIAQE